MSEPAASQHPAIAIRRSALRLVACYGKKAYATAREAHRALRRMTRRKAAWKHGNGGRRLTVYRCPNCDMHHIGGSPK